MILLPHSGRPQEALWKGADNRNRSATLNNIRQLMSLSELPEKQTTSVEELMQKLTGIDITVCPCCHKGRMQLYLEIPLARPPNSIALAAA